MKKGWYQPDRLSPGIDGDYFFSDENDEIKADIVEVMLVWERGLFEGGDFKYLFVTLTKISINQDA